MKNFKKKISKNIDALLKITGKKQKRLDGAILLARKGDEGVTFVEGHNDAIEGILKESCAKDKAFAALLKKVVESNEEEMKDPLKEFLSKSGIDVSPDIGLDYIEVKEGMSDKDINDLVNKILNKVKKNDKKNE